MVEAAVVPDYPEAVLLRYLVAELLAAGDILSDNAVELLPVDINVLAEIHLVVNYLKNGLFYAVLVLQVVHGGHLQIFGGQAALVELAPLAYWHCQADILLLCAVNERRIDSCM